MVKSKFPTFIKRHYSKILSTVFFLALFGAYLYTYAVPPTSPYQPGETLDPTCAPGDSNCFVQIIPDQTGHAGEYLTTDGSMTSWGTITPFVITNGNGTTANGTAVDLGGTIDHTTYIDLDGNNFEIGVTNFAGLLINTTIGVTSIGDLHNNNSGSVFRVDAPNSKAYFTDTLTDGKFGINNSNPSQALDVTGNVRFSGALMPNNSPGTNGQVLTSTGTGVAPIWTTLSTIATSVPISGLTAAIAPNSINNGGFNQTWAWNNTLSGTGLKISHTDSSMVTGATLFEILSTGAGATGSNTYYNFKSTISKDNSPGLNVNIASYFSASGGATNYAIIVPSGGGNVGIGTSTPATVLDIGGVTTFRGNIIAGTDNTYDIGASGATRPRTGYFGTSIIAPSGYFTPPVTTGTGATAGVQIAANSLTTGNALDVSSSSVTSGNLVFLSTTSAAATSNTQTVLRVSTSGANPVNQTTYGGYFINTHTGTNSVNTGLYATASGGTTNLAANFGAALLMSAATPCISFQLGTCGTNDNYVGRSSTILMVQGSGATTIAVGGTEYATAVTGVFRVGVNGSANLLVNTSTNSGHKLDVVMSGTGLTTSRRTINSTNGSTTYDTTAGVLSSYGGYFSSASTRSAGSNALINIGLYATASGAQNNYAAIFEDGNVGIGTLSPNFKLHIGSSSVVDGTTLLRLQDTNSTCDFNANSGGPTCGSDILLKKDIVSLSTGDLLAKVSALNPVSYRWLTEDSSDPLQNGFIAQEVAEQFPDLVTEHMWIDESTKKFLNMSGMMPYVVGAVKELNIKIQGLSSLDTTQNDSLGSLIKQFLADIGNGLENLFVKKIYTEELCIKKSDDSDICITGDQLEQLLEGITPISSGRSSGGNEDTENTGETGEDFASGSGDAGHTGSDVESGNKETPSSGDQPQL